MTNNLLLYGSFARGDNTSNSDIDLLSLVDGKCEKISYGLIELFLYNHSFFIKMAEEGSLFIFHLKEEAKILVDENQVFNQIFNKYFHLKANYNTEIIFSLELMRSIAKDYPNLTDYEFANRRIAWCARTTISALGANKQTPIFAPSDVINFFSLEVFEALDIKNSRSREDEKLTRLLGFCSTHARDIDTSDYFLSKDLEKYRRQTFNTIFGNYS